MFAVFVSLSGLTGVLHSFGAAVFRLYPSVELNRYLFSSVVYLLAGVLIFLLGRIIGRIVAKGIE